MWANLRLKTKRKKEKQTMKKFMMFAMLVLAMVSLAGCPQTGLQINSDDLNSVISLAPSSNAVETAKDTGKVVVQGDLYEDRGSSEKSLNKNDVVDSLIGYGTGMSFYFYPVNETDPPIPTTGKGKGWNPPLSFELKIENGRYFGEFVLPAKEYTVCVLIHDANYNTLFYANSSTSVVARQESVLNILFYLSEYFSYNFKILGLPGQYSEDYGSATIVLANGSVYYGSYSNSNYWGGKGKSLSGSNIVFNFWLPINFDGASDGAMLMVMSNNNTSYASALDFNILDAVGGEVFEVDYTIDENAGGVWVETSFAEYPEESGKG